MRSLEIQTEKITMEVPKLFVSYLQMLLATGLYGNSVEEVAHEIVAAELRRLVFEKATFPRQYR